MSFDRFAPHYRYFESLALGDALQQVRIACLPHISSPHHALIIGEGNGRFLQQFVRQFPAARVSCVEASARMIELARERLLRIDRRAGENVEFVHADIREIDLPASAYDLIVTHFVLDCFLEDDVARVVSQISRAAMNNAQWLLADFCVPVGAIASRRARFWLKIMYRFFRMVAAVEAHELVDPSRFLCDERFALVSQQLRQYRMLKSQLWRRTV